MQMKRLTLALAAVGMLAVAAFAADKVESGLKVGEQLSPFDVVDVSGPDKGKQLCLVWKNGGSPVVMAFVKDDPAKAASLVANIQKLTDTYKGQNLRSFVVFMGGAEMKNALEKVAADKKINIAMSFLPGGAGQGDLARYKINPAAKNTVLVYNRRQVKGNFVNVDDASFGEVVKTTATMLGN